MNLSKGYVESNVRLGPNIHACADGEEITRVERTVLEDEGVKVEAAKLKLPEGSVVVCDPWIYGKLSYSIISQSFDTLLTAVNRFRWYQ